MDYMMNDDSEYKRAYNREKKQRVALEILFEQKTFELFQANEMQSVQQENLIKSEKLASIGQLTTGIAHEINNPLAYVSSNIEQLINFSDQLLQLKTYIGSSTQVDNFDTFLEKCGLEPKGFNFLNDDYSEIINDINEGIKRIHSIVHNLSSYARTNDFNETKISINKAVLSTLHLMKSRLSSNVEVKTDFANVPDISANMNEIKQVVLNLCVNALDAMNDKGVLEISTSFNEDENYVYILIKDTGTGLSQEEQLKIFDPFYTSKPSGKGTGLGLYICYQIISTHNGLIELESSKGNGATFTVCLPITRNN